jgi:hypothetical protein
MSSPSHRLFWSAGAKLPLFRPPTRLRTTSNAVVTTREAGQVSSQAHRLFWSAGAKLPLFRPPIRLRTTSNAVVTTREAGQMSSSAHRLSWSAGAKLPLFRPPTPLQTTSIAIASHFRNLPTALFSVLSVPSVFSVLILFLSRLPLRLCNLCVSSFSSLFPALA